LVGDLEISFTIGGFYFSLGDGGFLGGITTLGGGGFFGGSGLGGGFFTILIGAI